jgi:hypothetical protein
MNSTPTAAELQEQLTQLKDQLKQMVEAYNILDEYVSELVVDEDDNETLKYTRSIVDIALSQL